MKWSPRTSVTIAVGMAATICSAAIGLASLRLRSRKEMPSRDWTYFLDRDRLQAPLMDSEIFSAPRVGYAGDPSPVTLEFLGVLADPKAEEKFVELVAKGAPGATLYGLCGLRIVGSKRLGDDLSSFVARWDDRRVALMDGCGLSVTTPRKVVRSPGFGNVCDLWGDAHRGATLPNTVLQPDDHLGRFAPSVARR